MGLGASGPQCSIDSLPSLPPSRRGWPPEGTWAGKPGASQPPSVPGKLGCLCPAVPDPIRDPGEGLLWLQPFPSRQGPGWAWTPAPPVQPPGAWNSLVLLLNPSA